MEFMTKMLEEIFAAFWITPITFKAHSSLKKLKSDLLVWRAPLLLTVLFRDLTSYRNVAASAPNGEQGESSPKECRRRKNKCLPPKSAGSEQKSKGGSRNTRCSFHERRKSSSHRWTNAWFVLPQCLCLPSTHTSQFRCLVFSVGVTKWFKCQKKVLSAKECMHA